MTLFAFTARRSEAMAASESAALINEQQQLRTVCQEFITGLRFAVRYTPHTGADPEQVIHHNLRLLHSNLSTIAGYRNMASLARLKATSSPGFNWLPLVDADNIQLGLLSQNEHHALRILPRTHTVGDDPDIYSMLLLLSGKARVTQYPVMSDGRKSASGFETQLKPQQSSLSSPMDATEMAVQSLSRASLFLYVRVPLAGLLPNGRSSTGGPWMGSASTPLQLRSA